MIGILMVLRRIRFMFLGALVRHLPEKVGTTLVLFLVRVWSMGRIGNIRQESIYETLDEMEQMYYQIYLMRCAKWLCLDDSQFYGYVKEPLWLFEYSVRWYNDFRAGRPQDPRDFWVLAIIEYSTDPIRDLGELLIFSGVLADSYRDVLHDLPAAAQTVTQFQHYLFGSLTPDQLGPIGDNLIPKMREFIN